MPIINVIGFKDPPIEELRKAFMKKPYYPNLHTAIYVEPYASALRNLSCNTWIPYFVINDIRGAERRTEDIAQTIKELYPKTFVCVIYLDKVY